MEITKKVISLLVGIGGGGGGGGEWGGGVPQQMAI